jgi:hypothetical protein
MSSEITDLPEDNQIVQAVVQVFEAVKLLAPAKLLSGLVPTERHAGYVHINYVPDYELQETCEFVNDFNSLLEKMDSTKMQVRMKVSVYCHIMESDYPFAVLWNLLRVLHNLPCKWTVTRLTKSGDEFTCEYTGEKIGELTRLGDALGLPTGEILARLWDSNLRNTFSHSQYALFGDNFTSTRNTSPFSRKMGKTLANIDISYSFEHIDALFVKSCGFLRIFVETYKHYIAPFKDGKSHQVEDGAVIWEHQLGRWTWTNIHQE